VGQENKLNLRRQAMDDMTIAAIILFGGGSLALIIGYYLIKRHEDNQSKHKHS
jgi:hypothetical protein